MGLLLALAKQAWDKFMEGWQKIKCFFAPMWPGHLRVFMLKPTHIVTGVYQKEKLSWLDFYFLS